MKNVTPDQKYIGSRIRAVRVTSEKTQAELGEVLGISHAAILNLESGKNNITVKTLSRIAKYFNRNIQDFIPEQDLQKMGFLGKRTKESLNICTTGTKISANELKSAREVGKVKITSKEVGYSTHVMVGDTELPVTKAVITIEMDNFVKLELETRADLVDIEALQRETELIIKRDASV